MAGTAQQVVLGEGILGWPRYERASGRFGTVLLTDDPKPAAPWKWKGFPAAPAGRWGMLTAEVIEVLQLRWPDDDPDAGPQPPCAAGDVITLGTGYLFRSRVNGGPVIGLRPDASLAEDDYGHEGWMDGEALYQVEDQRVRLVFTPVSDDSQRTAPRPEPPQVP
jgi:hypothetical protein